ncbi:MAG: hypothetical protein AAGJ08_10050 [Cyanobacteria bacterium P01_H01_bin.35]
MLASFLYIQSRTFLTRANYQLSINEGRSTVHRQSEGFPCHR